MTLLEARKPACWLTKWCQISGLGRLELRGAVHGSEESQVKLAAAVCVCDPELHAKSCGNHRSNVSPWQGALFPTTQLLAQINLK